MKKLILPILLAFSASLAPAQVFFIQDETNIKAFANNSSFNGTIGGVNYANPVDSIGGSPFLVESIQGVVTGTNVVIGFDTAWNFAAGGVVVGGVNVKTAALFLVGGAQIENPEVGDFNYVITFNGLSASLYQIGLGTVLTSHNLLGSTGLVYGGEYFHSDNITKTGPIPVQYQTNENALALGTVSYNNANMLWELSMDSSTLAEIFGGSFTLLWGTAECANDVIIGNGFGGDIGLVPEPSTYGILGALLLLGMIAQRRLRRSRK